MVCSPNKESRVITWFPSWWSTSHSSTTWHSEPHTLQPELFMQLCPHLHTSGHWVPLCALLIWPFTWIRPRGGNTLISVSLCSCAMPHPSQIISDFSFWSSETLHAAAWLFSCIPFLLPTLRLLVVSTPSQPRSPQCSYVSLHLKYNYLPSHWCLIIPQICSSSCSYHTVHM